MNLNPASSKGELDTPSFVVTVFVLGFVSAAVSAYFHSKTLLMQRDLDTTILNLHYAAWFLITASFFWMITTAFIKRWAAIGSSGSGSGSSSEPAKSSPSRTLCRLFLLSPLLSIWFIVFTLLHSIPGFARSFDSKWSRAGLAMASLVLFHGMYLGYRVAAKEVILTKSFSIKEVSKFDPVKSEQNLSIQSPMPNQFFYTQLFPYLSPVMKLGVTFYTDFMRSQAIYESALVNPRCVVRSDIPEVKVHDCFFARFQSHNVISPFASPIYAFYFETRFRQSVAKPTEPNSLLPFADSAVTISNLLWLLEPGSSDSGRERALKPTYLLKYLASPELPLIEIGQVLQRSLLKSKVLPLVEKPISEMEKIKNSLVDNSTPAQAVAISSWISRLRAEHSRLSQPDYEGAN
ncbi:MAG: hypothetical protein V4692_14580 [Bdellovibrionota bacterium]